MPHQLIPAAVAVIVDIDRDEETWPLLLSPLMWIDMIPAAFVAVAKGPKVVIPLVLMLKDRGSAVNTDRE